MHFTESDIWKTSITLGKQVLVVAERLPSSQRFVMCPQLSRAAISVSSNIAEGWSRESLKQELRFFDIAQGSLYEVHSQLILCAEMNWLPDQDISRLIEIVGRLGRMLSALRKNLRRRTRAAAAAARVDLP